VREVSFSFDDSREVLNSVSFICEVGRTLALVGANGAGKTTICHLIKKYLAPTRGTILLHGRDISEIPTSLVRRDLVLMNKDPWFFAHCEPRFSLFVHATHSSNWPYLAVSDRARILQKRVDGKRIGNASGAASAKSEAGEAPKEAAGNTPAKATAKSETWTGTENGTEAGKKVVGGTGVGPVSVPAPVSVSVPVSASVSSPVSGSGLGPRKSVWVGIRSEFDREFPSDEIALAYGEYGRSMRRHHLIGGW